MTRRLSDFRQSDPDHVRLLAEARAARELSEAAIVEALRQGEEIRGVVARLRQLSADLSTVPSGTVDQPERVALNGRRPS